MVVSLELDHETDDSSDEEAPLVLSPREGGSRGLQTNPKVCEKRTLIGVLIAFLGLLVGFHLGGMYNGQGRSFGINVTRVTHFVGEGGQDEKNETMQPPPSQGSPSQTSGSGGKICVVLTGDYQGGFGNSFLYVNTVIDWSSRFQDPRLRFVYPAIVSHKKTGEFENLFIPDDTTSDRIIAHAEATSTLHKTRCVMGQQGYKWRDFNLGGGRNFWTRYHTARLTGVHLTAGWFRLVPGTVGQSV